MVKWSRFAIIAYMALSASCGYLIGYSTYQNAKMFATFMLIFAISLLLIVLSEINMWLNKK